MAHGALYLLGGYLGLSMVLATKNFWLALLAGGFGIVILYYFLDRFLIRRTGENHLAQVLLTVGSLLSSPILPSSFGEGMPRLPAPAFTQGPIQLAAGLYYPRYRFLLIVFGVIVGILLWLIYKKTQIGAIVRAGVDDREMVSAMGININRLAWFSL
jgi:branched-chain amino acid transport system permease protein